MIRYALRIQDKQVRKEFDEVINDLNPLVLQWNDIVAKLDSLHIPTMSEIQRALQQGGSNPLNLTGLQGRGGT